MKIIKKGNKKPKEVKTTCEKCGTVFTYNNSDTETCQRDGTYVKCPICKTLLAAEIIVE